MKKLLSLLVLVTTITQAQYTIKGTMSPLYKSNWVILYKIEGARQVFISNTNSKKDTIFIHGKKQEVAKFQFQLPKNAKSGSYRVTYNTEEAGFVDFLFNKENIEFSFNPTYPEQSIEYSISRENKLYKEYLQAINLTQHTLDSIQIIALQKPKITQTTSYKQALARVNDVQQIYLNKSKGMMVNHFIKATLRKNAPTIILSMQDYLTSIVKNFFLNMNFNDSVLYNSSFLVDRITDYIFYLNYSKDSTLQQKLYKESVEKVMNIVEKPAFKKDVIEFLVTQFEARKNVDMVDELFTKYYDKLPKTLQNKKFKEEKLQLLAAEVGRIAPDFSWEEGKKFYKLSTLNDANNYVLVFWSTECSHCLKEIPQLYKFMKDKKNTKVIAFALEKNIYSWNNYILKLKGWHNVLGLNKWQNKTAKNYQVYSTPNYFILNKNKKIITKPTLLKDVKKFFKKK